MWTVKENRNSNAETEDCFCKLSKGRFPEFGQKMDLLSFIVSPKSNFKIEQPFQKFLCTWAVTHPPQESGPAGKGRQSPRAPLPWPGTCRQTQHLLTLPMAQRRKRMKPCSPKGWWHWYGSGTRSTIRLQNLHSNFPIILTQLVSPSTVSSGAWFMWSMVFCSFKPMLVRHERRRRRLSSVATEKQCSKSATAVLMRLVSLLWLCH